MSVRPVRFFQLALLLVLVALGGARPLLAWGREGHYIVATIAESLLSPGARARALPDGRALPAPPLRRRLGRP